jgi:hypothetical protein
MATISWTAPSGHTDEQKVRPKNKANTSGMLKNTTAVNGIV